MNGEEKTDNKEEIVIKGKEEVVGVSDERLVDIKKEEKIIEAREIEEKRYFKNQFKDGFNFLKQKKIINIMIIILFAALLIWSSNVRVQNMPLLKDSTTGEYIPLALDPFYFLRVAETMVSDQGLPEYDPMRYPSLQTSFTEEILPEVVIFVYNVGGIFDGNITLRYADVIYPVVFFILGLIIFFFLVLSITKSKWIALLSSAFLAVIPPYLYRTMAGFADHEAVGMFAFFITLLLVTISLKNLSEKRSFKINVILGLLLALSTAFTIVAWSGIATFVFMIIPLAFFIFWLVNSKREDSNKVLLGILLFYVIWFVFTILFGNLLGFSVSTILRRFVFGTSGLMGGVTLLFMIIDYLLIKNWKKIVKRELPKYRILFSGAIMIVLGAIIYSIFVGGVWDLFGKVIDTLLYPFGRGRVGLTVAENKQPYLSDFFSQIGKTAFWLFYAGMAFAGINLARGVMGRKHKIGFFLAWMLFISGLLFSRISPSSVFNGENFISRLFYFGGILIFIIYFIWIYFNRKISIKYELIIIIAWLVPMLIALRGAIRLFFLIVPFICFMVGYLFFNIVIYFKKSKEEVLRFFFLIGGLLVIVLMLLSFVGYAQAIPMQAKSTGPSANVQWQRAMEWVRDNTNKEDIFIHWWDYGYWVQYLGERTSITDGGHASSYWDHLIGRYILTTPNPNTALSFMKTHDVSYLLIDPTDIGKYSAYSSIGSDDIGNDRFSWIPILVSNPQQIQETRNGTMRFYQGGVSLDQDIIYSVNNTEIFLPAEKAGLAGIIIETQQQNNSIEFKQPQGIFVYNGQQTPIPLRYLEYEGQFHDFKDGISASVKIIPMFRESGGQSQIDGLGAVMYLSPKVAQGLVAQLYLMNDPLDNYPTLGLAHSEPDPAVQSLKDQGANLNEFLYYRGLRGPIKIWKTDYPEDIITREEFFRTSGEWAEFDNLTFTK